MSEPLHRTGMALVKGVEPEPTDVTRTEYSPASLHTAKEYLEKFADKGDVVPTIEGLADELKRGRKTVYNWGDENPDFQDVLDQIMSKQGRLLQNKGLKKETDSGITKLMLSANHGMAEKREDDVKLSGSLSLAGILGKTDQPQDQDHSKA